jgi:hypothetical protein
MIARRGGGAWFGTGPLALAGGAHAGLVTSVSAAADPLGTPGRHPMMGFLQLACCLISWGCLQRSFS